MRRRHSIIDFADKMGLRSIKRYCATSSLQNLNSLKILIAFYLVSLLATNRHKRYPLCINLR